MKMKQSIFVLLQLLAPGSDKGCIFFAVERFDYTKGIAEKLKVAFIHEFKKQC